MKIIKRHDRTAGQVMWDIPTVFVYGRNMLYSEDSGWYFTVTFPWTIQSSYIDRSTFYEKHGPCNIAVTCIVWRDPVDGWVYRFNKYVRPRN